MEILTKKQKLQLVMGKLSDYFYKDFDAALKDAEKIKRIALEIQEVYD